MSFVTPVCVDRGKNPEVSRLNATRPLWKTSTLLFLRTLRSVRGSPLNDQDVGYFSGFDRSQFGVESADMGSVFCRGHDDLHGRHSALPHQQHFGGGHACFQPGLEIGSHGAHLVFEDPGCGPSFSRTPTLRLKRPTPSPLRAGIADKAAAKNKAAAVALGLQERPRKRRFISRCNPRPGRLT